MRKTKLELELKHGISLKLENAVVINFFFKTVSRLFSIKLAFVPTQTETRKRSAVVINF